MNKPNEGPNDPEDPLTHNQSIIVIIIIIILLSIRSIA